MDARLRLLSCLGYVLIVVSVPPERLDLLGGLALLPLATAILARVSPLALLRRLLLLAPFVLIAAAGPLLREGGLDAALGMLAKAGLGCSALVLLAATTPVDELLAALAALRCPRFLVLQLGLTARYLHLLGEEAQRLRCAALARGFTPRHLLQARIIGDLIGALFLRSVARAERVHAAMLARGFAGELVPPEPRRLSPSQTLLATGVLGCALAWRLCWS